MPARSPRRLTIVLTLKDRPEFTHRWMRFMNDQRCPYKILIADGGADKAIEAQLRDSANYPHLDYEYIRYPYDKDWTDFYTKKQDVCEKVETEYLLLADNDDFYLIDKIPCFIDFLDCNPDYIGCRGEVLQFYLFSKEGDVVNAPVGESYEASRLKSKSIENEKLVERATCLLNEGIQHEHFYNWYCVLRSKKAVRSMKDLYKYRFTNVGLNEILFSLMLLREGKIKIIDSLYYVRQVGSSQANASLDPDNLIESFVINDVFHHFNNFILSEGFVLEENDRLRILKAFANFVGIFCNYHTDKYRNQYRTASVMEVYSRSFRSLLKRNATLYHFLRRLKRRFSHVLPGRKLRCIQIPIIEEYILRRKAAWPSTS